jgi:hypothetical protein
LYVAALLAVGVPGFAESKLENDVLLCVAVRIETDRV